MLLLIQVNVLVLFEMIALTNLGVNITNNYQ
jgi:hypothetical protein